MKVLKNNRGQAILESVLLMALTLAVWAGVSKALKSQEVFQNVFGKPWVRLANVIEFGIPSSGSRTEVGPKHPTSYDRQSTRKGTD